MAVKKCCIEKCNSCSTRKEDIGVTYHKFPKDTTLRDAWITASRRNEVNGPTYVCSRHFCKNDFKIYKDSKYVLKSDAVPSIFPWKVTDKTETSNMEEQTAEETNKTAEETNKTGKELSSRKVSEGENVEAIKQFIEDQDKEISDQKSGANTPVVETVVVKETEPSIKEIEVKVETAEEKPVIENVEKDETIAVASSVMDMILTQSEAKIAEKCDGKTLASECVSSGDKANTNALSVGSKVEARDYRDFWYPAEIIEVDYEEMEVLVHYDDVSKNVPQKANSRLDEWISVSSPRLRPKGSGASTPIPEPAEAETTSEPVAASHSVPLREPKTEEKRKVTFEVDERVLARWRDNRRFAATVSQDFGDGNYEIMFDDGVRWTCTKARLYKLKDNVRKDCLSVDTTTLPSTTSTLSPVYGAGPSVGQTGNPGLPAYHTHLFDPTRDYLGSKSERREMKRKLNIKEIFNIGQKKKKVDVTPKEKTMKVVKDKKSKVVKKKIKIELVDIKTEVKKEIPDAVASIIGTAAKDQIKEEVKQENKIIKEEDIKEEETKEEIKMEVDNNLELDDSETLSAPETMDMKHDDGPVGDEEVKLEKFEQTDDVKHEQVIVRIKEVINKLEGGLNQVDNKDLDPPKLEINEENVINPPKVVSEGENQEKPRKPLSKVKKSKKLRLLQEKKVKKQVEKAKCELEEIKKQVAEMKKQMLMKTEELAKAKVNPEMPESFLLPGEWCCKWVNGQPVGMVSELESEVKVDGSNKQGLPRRSVQVEDKRLPEGWTKHMVRRSVGHSAGKWDVVLVSPDNRRFHTKTDMRNYLENNPNEALKPFELSLMDFGVHLKLSRRMGWYTTTPGAEPTVVPLPAGTLASTSPLVKRKKLSLKKSKLKDKKKKLCVKLKVPREFQYRNFPSEANAAPGVSGDQSRPADEAPIDIPPLEDGYVYVGSLKVQIIENLLRCPAENCFKNFRNNTLLKMHIKHYHRELRKMLGATPKVLDLAYARTRPSQVEMRRLKFEAENNKTIRIKIPRLPKRFTDPKPTLEPKDISAELDVEAPTTPVKTDAEKLPKTQDSPKLRHALINKPVKRPKVLLPVRRPEINETIEHKTEENDEENVPLLLVKDLPNLETLDFETAISTHTVTKPFLDIKKKSERKRKSFAKISKKESEDEEWFSMNNNSDVETRSSYPRSGTPDSKTMDQKLVSSESNEEQKDPNAYMFSESGERIKIVHMKREEIINCHCGFREEDGLMVQCELCLCWQHALCHNIQKESEVPEKYTCSICLNPRRGRRSQRFLHDQDRLYEGLLPGAKPCESLRRSHELSGNLLRIEDALHALKVKYYVATKKDHPKLYLWAKDWETAEITMTQERLNSDYSDLNIMISNIGKENLPVKPEEMNMSLNIGTPPSEEQERYSHRDGLGSQALLSGLLSSPGGASLDLPISTSELERLAKTVQEQEVSRVIIPQPEAAIENSACRERLLKHIQRCQALIDARLDSIEAQVAELESQDPSFEDDETADYCPRTKQTIQMLMRDLDTMEELGVIT